MSANPIPSFEAAIVEAVAAILGDTGDGLTGSQIGSVMSAIGLRDPLAEAEASDPAVRQGLAWVRMSKRERIATAIARNQQKTKNGNALVGFIAEALSPARYVGEPKRHERYRISVNQVLALEGLKVTEKGKVAKGPRASTLSEAARLAGALTTELRRREAHNLVLAYCTEEIIAGDPFHAVHEAVKGIFQRLRDMTDSTADGRELIDQTLGRSGERLPLLRLNSLGTDTDWNEQMGLASLVRGLWARYRNPTSHETRAARTADRPILERELLEVLTTVSLVHHALDAATPVARPVAMPDSGVDSDL